MKNFTKVSLFAVAALSAGLMTTNAKVMTAADIDKALTFDSASGDADPAYIFGKHVYVNEFTMADSIAAANTLDGQTDAILIYKNGKNVWTNAITNETVDKANFSMEMVKLIGEPNDGFVSYDSNLNAERVEQITRSGESRVEDVFLDENSPIQIVGMNKVTPNSLGGTVDADDIHKYNTSAMDIKYSGNRLTLTEKTPLLEYYNKQANGTGKWVGILVKTNKALPERFTLTVGTTAYNQSDLKKLDGTSQGAKTNEILVWVKTTDLRSSSFQVKFKDNTPVKAGETAPAEQVINVTYNYPKTGFTAEVKGTDAIQVTSKDADVTVQKIGEKYIAIFSAKENVNYIDFTLNGDNKRIAANNSIQDVLTVKENSVSKKVTAVDSQSYLTISNVEKDSSKEDTYNVTVTTNRKITGALPLAFDFRAALSAPSAGVQLISGTNYSVPVTFVNNVATVTVTDNNATKKTSITLVITLVEDIPSFDLQSVKTANVGSEVNIDPVISGNAGAIGAIREVARLNSQSIGNKITLEEVIDPATELKTGYTVKINNENELNKLGSVISGQISGKATYTSASKVVALIVDFGVDPKNISLASSVVGGYVLGIGTNLSATEQEILTKLGVSGTEFVVVVVDNTAAKNGVNPNSEIGKLTVTFKNTISNVDSAVTFNVVERAANTFTSITPSSTLTIDPSYTSFVAYDKENNKVMIDEDLTYFKVVVDGVAKSYQYVTDGWFQSESVILSDAEIAKHVAGVTASEHNQGAARVTGFGSDYINVEYTKDLDSSKDLFILVNLGKKFTFVNSPKVEAADPQLLTTEQKKTADNYAVLKVTVDANAVKESKVVVPVQVSGTVVVQNITINLTKVENPSDIKPVSGHAIELGTGNNTLNNSIGAARGSVKFNAEAVTKVEVTNEGVVRVYLDKSIAALKEWHNAYLKDKNNTEMLHKKNIGVALNLNTNVQENSLFSGKNVNSDFGATSSETLFWINASEFVACTDGRTNCYTHDYTFTNDADDNKFNTATITFELIVEPREFKLSGTSMLSSADVPEIIKKPTDIAGYKNNQDNFALTATTDQNGNVTLTINPVKEGLTPVLYSRSDSEESRHGYIAVRVDLDTELMTPLATIDGVIGVERIADTNSYILWICAENAGAASQSFTLTSAYDEVSSFNLTVKYETTVKAD